MSDTPQGPGWWQASDGRFYPPQQHPTAAWGSQQTQQRSWGSQPTPPPYPPQAPQWQKPQNKRKGCLYAVLVVLAVIIAIVVAVGVAANHVSNNVKTSGNLGGPAPAAHYSIGQIGKSGGFAFTVYSIKAPYAAPDGFAPTAGDEYVVVDVQVQNLDGNKQEPFSSLIGFHLLDVQNHQYDETIIPGLNPSAPDGQIAAGQAIRGYVGFEVPTGTTGLKLRSQGSMTSAGAVFTLTP